MPQHLADIFMTAKTDEAYDKRPSRRITGVRVLTSNEYVEMMREKDMKEKEAAEQRQKRKEERESKKREREKEEEKRQRRRKGKKRQCRTSPGSDDENETSNFSDQAQRDEDTNSEVSDTVCMLCNARKPPVSRGSIVFWVDCDGCGEWAPHLLRSWQ